MPWKYNITVNIDPRSRNQGIDLCSHYLLAPLGFVCRAARLKITTAAPSFRACTNVSTSISANTTCKYGAWGFISAFYGCWVQRSSCWQNPEASALVLAGRKEKRCSVLLPGLTHTPAGLVCRALSLAASHCSREWKFGRLILRLSVFPEPDQNLINLRQKHDFL